MPKAPTSTAKRKAASTPTNSPGKSKKPPSTAAAGKGKPIHHSMKRPREDGEDDDVHGNAGNGGSVAPPAKQLKNGPTASTSTRETRGMSKGPPNSSNGKAPESVITIVASECPSLVGPTHPIRSSNFRSFLVGFCALRTCTYYRYSFQIPHANRAP